MALATPRPHQLALPLTLPPDPVPLPLSEPLLPPAAIWASLSPSLQTRVYQTVLWIAAEVVRDADRV